MLSAALGSLVGLVLALTGAGGGVLAVPLLVFALHLKLNQAGPVGLLSIALAAGIGALLGLRDGVVRYRAAALVAGFGVAAAPLGLWLAQQIPNRPLALLFAVALSATSLRLLHQARRQPQHGGPGHLAQASSRRPCRLDASTGRLIWTLPCARAMAVAGLASGLLSGLLGVGGGFVMVPALRMATDLPMHSIVATSLAVITLISCAGVATATLMHALPWAIAWPFALGAAGGLLIGRSVAARLAGPQLQMLFALLGLLVAALMAWRVH